MIHEHVIDRSKLRPMATPGRVLLTSPDHFQVRYVINPHMAGNLGSVDPERARFQWDVLRSTYERLGLDVHTLPGRPGLPDMVFCANQTLPFLDSDGIAGVVPSRMASAERAPEVETFSEYFTHLGLEIRPLESPHTGSFEGMGDAIWHAGRRLLWGGYGFRTDRNIYPELERKLSTDIAILSLDDPDFYHLDTCLSILDEETAIIFRGAYRDEGLELLRSGFPRLIETPEDEARGLFACNAHCPDGRHVIIQRGCEHTCRALRAAGYEPVEIDTDEFLKSGGSVFCMKLMFW